MVRRITVLSVVVCALMMLTTGTAMAQRGAGGAGGGGGGGGGAGGAGGGGGRRGGGGGGFDPTAQIANTLDNIQQRLGATDAEWAVLRPKVEKVVMASRDVQSAVNRGRGGAGGGGGGRRGGGGAGPGGGAAQPATSAVARALQDLEIVLANENATADQISQKLTALRDAKVKAANTLAAAQKDLKDLLTSRQEAVLVTMGYLE